MTGDTIKNLDALLNLKEELLKMKNQKTEKLKEAIKKRRQIKEHLCLIMKSIKDAEEQIQQLQDENNLRLTEMASILELNKSSNVINPTEQNQQDKQKGLFLSQELMELVDDSCPDDTTETLKLKMIQSVELCDRMLVEATAAASEFNFQKKVKIQVQILDEKNQIRQELILINHVITLFLRGQNVNLESKQPAPMTVVCASATKNTKGKPGEDSFSASLSRPLFCCPQN